MGFGCGQDAEFVEEMGGAVLIGRGTVLAVEAEDLVFERLESFEDLVDARVETTGAGRELFAGHTVLEPHVFGRAD